MRRGRGGYIGGNRPPMPSNYNIPRHLQPPQHEMQARRSGLAPLMPNLQGLKDIDMELELLKRKREIIEQQQQILSSTSFRHQRNDYEQASYSQPRDNWYDDYSRLYDDRGSGSRRGGGRDSYVDSRKRPHIPVWESEVPVPAKRFSAPSRGAKRPFNSRPSPQPSRPIFQRTPVRGPAPKPFKRPPPSQPRKKEFNPTKVSKPAPDPLMKLKRYQPADRKWLVAETVASGETRRPDDSLLLRADVTPSHLMVGRLELALGAVIKDVKTAYPEHKNIFKSPYVLRVMKQFVRDRVRVAMIGQYVNNSEQIKQRYYEMFSPDESNKAIITRVLQAHQNRDIITTNADNPEAFFKQNIQQLMVIKVEEMFNKLRDLYPGGALPVNKPLKQYKNRSKQYYKLARVNIPQDESQEVKPQKGGNEESQSKTGETDGPNHKTGETDEPNHKTGETDEPNNKTEETDEAEPKVESEKAKLITDDSQDAGSTPNEALPEETPETEKMQANGDSHKEMETNSHDEVKDDTQTEVITAENQVTEAKTKADKNNENNTPEIKVNRTGKTGNTKNSAPKRKVNMKKISNTNPLNTMLPSKFINTEQYMALDKLMTYKMLHLLKKFTPEIVKLMDADEMYRKVKFDITNETIQTLKKKQGLVDDTSSSSPSQNEAGERKRVIYFVKILGKPALPKRNAMEVFFRDYQPATVKKHRTMHNLLFVGFFDKESYEKILAADGTVVGRFTLSIKSNNYKHNKKIQENAEKSEEDNLEKSVDSDLGSELDNQITDLLASIRNTDGEDVEMTEPTDLNSNQGDTTVASDQTTEELINEDDDVVEVKDALQNNDVIEINDSSEGNDAVKPDVNKAEETTPNDEERDVVKDVKGTPTRASARLATTGIKTRRMSKLAD